MKETTENNKLLAEFLGSEIEETLKGKKVYCLNLPNKHDISGFKKEFFLIEELSFHNDWNWLMLAVDKIESLYNGGFDVSILTDGTIIHQYRLTPNGDLCEGNEVVRFTCVEQSFDKKIDHTYHACVEFIKWFNSQSK